MNEKDTLFSDPSRQAGDFVFDERVVRVFPDMIRRSVPGYGLVVPSIALLARRYAQPGSRIYDLGCSLGAVTLAVCKALKGVDYRPVAVDNSPEMIRGLESTLAGEGPGWDGEGEAGLAPVEPLLADILDIRVEDASVVVLNLTLQFIDPDKRRALLKGIAGGPLCADAQRARGSRHGTAPGMGRRGGALGRARGGRHAHRSGRAAQHAVDAFRVTRQGPGSREPRPHRGRPSGAEARGRHRQLVKLPG